MKKIFLLGTLCFFAIAAFAQNAEKKADKANAQLEQNSEDKTLEGAFMFFEEK